MEEELYFGEGYVFCNPDQVKREGWKEQGLLAVALDDQRLTWPERELVRQLGEKLYGKCLGQKEVSR